MTAEQPTGIPPRRRPKGDKRARTRTRLIEAARAVIREKGYARTTIKDVADRAGVTSGAIYGNFRDRDELFIAVAEVAWAPIKPTFAPDSSFREKMRALAAATIAAASERRLVAQGRLAGMAYTLSHEEIRERVRDITAESYSAGAAWLRGVAQDDELPMAPETLVRVLHALTEGLLFQRFLTPELISDEVFYAAFDALANPLRTPDPSAEPRM
jgi:AcrR family transcriptional regulator